MRKRGLYERLFKRFLDIVVSFFGILFLLPLLIIIAILVRFKLGSPVLFKQERPGKHEKIFKLYKFRTMTNKKDEDGNLLPDEMRLTKFGKFLRSTSLDELPELFNILTGKMSLVGPRPLAVQYLPFYTEEERIRHQVRPGLTGYAQVNGRNAISWEERFEYDRKYVEKITFTKDVKIVIKTFVSVLKRDNIGERNKGASIDFDTYRQKQRGEKDEFDR